jgi:hypothetical protein
MISLVPYLLNWLSSTDESTKHEGFTLTNFKAVLKMQGTLLISNKHLHCTLGNDKTHQKRKTS